MELQIRFGYRVYGLATACLGLVGLVWSDFASVWQPVPPSLPGRTVLADVVALALVAGGGAVQFKRSMSIGAGGLALLFLAGALMLHGPKVISRPLMFASWSGLAEQLALVAGGVTVFASLWQGDDETYSLIVRVSEVLFGICLIFFGFAHVFYLSATASLVPTWLPPGQVFWACATGLAHGAAGIALIGGRGDILAARLVTAMFVVFGALVHAPTLFVEPYSHLNWSANAMNFVLVGSAWAIADSLSARRRYASAVRPEAEPDDPND